MPANWGAPTQIDETAPMEPPAQKRRRTASRLVVYRHADCDLHETTTREGEHQESRARVAAIAEALGHHGTSADFEPAGREALLRVHTDDYLDALEGIGQRRGRLSPILKKRHPLEDVDGAAGATIVGPGSWEAATRAAGAALARAVTELYGAFKVRKWACRGDGSRRRRGCRVDSPRTGRGAAAAAAWSPGISQPSG